MSSFYHELDVDSHLQCPVCFELPQNINFFQCKTGHHLCEKCRQKLTLCPVCQAALTGCRNLLAETLVSLFSVFQDEGAQNNNQSNGPAGDSRKVVAPSNRIIPNKNILKSLNLCSGIFKCALESCRNHKGIGAGEMFEHVANVHSHLYNKYKNKTATFNQNFGSFCLIKSKHNYHRAFHVSNMGMFFLNLHRLPGNYINCWISTPATVKRANLFVYEIEFLKEGGPKKIMFLNTMASTLQTPNWLLERGRVFILAPHIHKLVDGEFFSLIVTIVYKPPVE